MHTEPRTSLSGLTRRASLVALGAAGLSVAVSPRATKGKKKGKANKRCKPQVAQCQSFFTGQCEGDVNAPDCAARVKCCELLGTCNFDGLITCLQPLM